MELMVSINRAARLKVKRYSKIEHANANWMKVGVAITSHSQPLAREDYQGSEGTLYYDKEADSPLNT